MSKTDVYLNKQLFDALGVTADKKSVSRAFVLNEYLTTLCVGKEDAEKPVVLQIPSSLLVGNREGLEHWLGTRSAAILDYFYPED